MYHRLVQKEEKSDFVIEFSTLLRRIHERAHHPGGSAAGGPAGNSRTDGIDKFAGAHTNPGSLRSNLQTK